MVEVLRVVLGVSVVVSLLTIVCYGLLFLATAAGTVLGAQRRDPLADELDEFLAVILGPRTPGGSAEPGEARTQRNR